MRREDVERIEQISAPCGDLPGHIVANDGHLARLIIEDWLNVTLPMWKMFYGQLGKDILEGHLSGPSPSQAYILRRMRDKGHRIAAVRGMLRWIGGSDVRIYRSTMRIMLESGWLRMGSSAIKGLEYILEPTERGMNALANYELDREDRAYP